MIFEHFALNVKKPQTMAKWYVKNVGLTIIREQSEPPFMTFLADKTGRVICELYFRPEQTVLDFSNQHALTFHFAMESMDAEADKSRLIEAGASLFEEQKLEDGSHLVMLRDPWGICLQLCQRAVRMNKVELN